MLPVDNRTRSYNADDTVQKAEEARQLALNRIRSQQSADARRYNSGRKNIQYEPGDYVWLRAPVRHQGLCEKLLRRYFGPYKIVRRLSDVNYEFVPQSANMSSSRRRARAEIAHVVRMKPYYAREEVSL